MRLDEHRWFVLLTKKWNEIGYIRKTTLSGESAVFCVEQKNVVYQNI